MISIPALIVFIVSLILVCWIIQVNLSTRSKICSKCHGEMVLKRAENWGEIYICTECLNEEK